MASRYLVSGAQLGLLMGLAKSGDCKTIVDVIEKDILDSYLMYSERPLEKDLEIIKKLLEEIGATDD